ncbi:MAG: type II toxin-antitoxin system VapC family toxin [Acidobacteriota bacterium]
MKYFIDANIFLEVELQDKRKEECEKFLTRISEGVEGGIISDFIMYSILLQLTNRSTLAAARDFLTFLEQADIEIMVSDMQALHNALKIMKSYNLDFDDALVISIMAANKVNRLISFDKDFDRINDERLARRIEPKDIVSL